MESVNCDMVRNAYNVAKMKLGEREIPVNYKTSENQAIVLNTPDNQAMIDGLQATKPVGLEISYVSRLEMRSIPDKKVWEAVQSKLAELGGVSIHELEGEKSYKFFDKSLARKVLIEVMPKVPSWIEISQEKTLIMEKDMAILRMKLNVQVLSVTLSVDKNCR